MCTSLPISEISIRRLFLFAAWFFVLALFAGDVSAKSLLVDFPMGDYPFEKSSKAIRLVGDIDENSYEELVAVYKHLEIPGDYSVLFLDSKGGDVKDAFRIARFISEKGITTVVDRNAQCLSACAFIFMAGRTPAYEGPGGISRYLHLRGDLGFHAPFLPYSDAQLPMPFPGTYGEVKDAYWTGLRQIGALLSGPVTTGAQWPPSLVGETLLTPDKKYRYVKTIEDAGRWGIELFGFADTHIKLDKRGRYITCMNHFRWKDEDIWQEYSNFKFLDTENISGATAQQIKIRDQGDRTKTTYTPIDENNALGCYIYNSKEDNNAWIATDLGIDDEVINKSVTLDPTLRLDQIPSAD
jgi:hypothetical protein